MSPAKVTLSSEERELVTATGWILTKNAIIQKVYQLFGEVSAAYTLAWEKSSIDDKEIIGTLSPKISRGEQYEGLPWVMLDQPRYYTQEDGFGIRSFFWWGNGFSITLQLTGKYQLLYAGAIHRYFTLYPERSENWLMGTGQDQWAHHFREDNYKALELAPEVFSSHHFIKLTKRFPLQEWDRMPELLNVSFEEILQMLGNI